MTLNLISQTRFLEFSSKYTLTVLRYMLKYQCWNRVEFSLSYHLKYNSATQTIIQMNKIFNTSQMIHNITSLLCDCWRVSTLYVMYQHDVQQLLHSCHIPNLYWIISHMVDPDIWSGRSRSLVWYIQNVNGKLSYIS